MIVIALYDHRLQRADMSGKAIRKGFQRKDLKLTCCLTWRR